MIVKRLYVIITELLIHPRISSSRNVSSLRSRATYRLCRVGGRGILITITTTTTTRGRGILITITTTTTTRGRGILITITTTAMRTTTIRTQQCIHCARDYIHTKFNISVIIKLPPLLHSYELSSMIYL